MPLQGILQSRWLKGLQAAYGLFSQPPNSVPRVSNLLLTRLGSWLTTPGSRIISSFQNLGALPWNPATVGMWKEIFYYKPNDHPEHTGYYGLFETNQPSPRIPNPTTPPTANVVTITGAVAFPNTQFALTVADGVGGETLLSPPVTVVTGANQGIQFSWTRTGDAAGYNIYLLNAGVWQRLVPFGAIDRFATMTVPNPPTSFLSWAPSTSSTPTGYAVGDQIGVNIPAGPPAGPLYIFSVIVAGNSGMVEPSWPTGFEATVTDGSVVWINNGLASTATTIHVTLADIPPNNLLIGSAIISVSPGSVIPPATNTTQSCELIRIPVDGTGWRFTDSIFTFPADLLPNPGGSGSGQQGGGPVATSGGGSSGTISGGVIGTISPIPQILQFADRMFLALGNGITPYVSDGTSTPCSPPGPSAIVPPGTCPIQNTFTADYPFWEAGIGYIVGDQIYSPVITNPLNPVVNEHPQPPPHFLGPAFIFTAIQGGISQGGPAASGGGTQGNGQGPDFAKAALLGQTVHDGQVIWKNTGPTTSPAPLGAAHCEVYAGSLWIANTRPTFDPANPDDGPSAIWMSDANNPNSWNPLNTAQIARDDGTEIMGLKAFSIAEAGIPTTQQLAIFKNFTTYIINGVFGAADFAIQQALTDQGCIAPRSIQFVPGFGLMRLTHLGFSYFNSVTDVLISTDIHPYLFGDINQPDISPIDWAFAYFSKGAQVADPPMYIAAVPVLGDNSGPCPPPTLGAGCMGVLPAGQFTITPEVIGAGFPAGTYFFRITLRGLLVETAITPEIQVTLSSPGTFVVSTSVPLPVGYTGWRIYWGANGPGSESHYQDTGPELFSPTGIAVILAYPGISTTGPPIGLSGTMTRIFCYDLTLKSWTIVDLPFSISVLKHFRIMGEPPIVISGGFWDTTVRRLFSNAPDWDSVPIDWRLRSTEVYNQGGDMRVHYRRLRIRGSGQGPINVLPNFDGFDDVMLPTIFRALGANQFQAEAGLMAEAINCHVDISGQGRVLIDSLNFHATPTVVGAGAVIS